MSSDKVSQKYKDLLSDGPATADNLNGHPAVDARRIYGIRKFNPKDQTTAVWHLEDHNRERVLRLWLETNRSNLEANNVTRRSMSYALSKEWMETWREIKEDYEWLKASRSNEGGANKQNYQTCPKCGKDDVLNLPRHLRGCDGEDDE